MLREYDKLTETATLICLIHFGNPRKRRLRKAIKLVVETYCREYLDKPGRHSVVPDLKPLNDMEWDIYQLLIVAKQKT